VNHQARPYKKWLFSSFLERESMKPPQMKLITDFTEAQWVQETLYPWDDLHIACLGVFIPVGFQSYLTIRHENTDPLLGSVSSLNFERLTLMLCDFTETPDDCFVGIWCGFGWGFEDQYSDLFKSFSRCKEFDQFFNLPNREYYLLQCEVLESLKIGQIIFGYLDFQRPNLMWPRDKSWFISNEIDFDVTLVGGSEELIREIENYPYFVTERFDPAVPNRGIYRADWML
jgi:hypothetical protein